MIRQYINNQLFDGANTTVCCMAGKGAHSTGTMSRVVESHSAIVLQRFFPPTPPDRSLQKAMNHLHLNVRDC